MSSVAILPCRTPLRFNPFLWYTLVHDRLPHP